MDDFLEYTSLMNQRLKRVHSLNKEFVTDAVAAKAIENINNISIKDNEDVLLYCASLNICNTYVKQANSKIDYSFKQKVVNVLEAIDALDIEDMYFDFGYDKKMPIVYIQVGKVQFSFHYVKIPRKLKRFLINSRHKTFLTWDGIKKQQCAVTTFRLAEHAHNGSFCVTLRVQKLWRQVRKLVFAMIKNLKGLIKTFGKY